MTKHKNKGSKSKTPYRKCFTDAKILGNNGTNNGNYFEQVSDEYYDIVNEYVDGKLCSSTRYDKSLGCKRISYFYSDGKPKNVLDIDERGMKKKEVIFQADGAIGKKIFYDDFEDVEMVSNYKNNYEHSRIYYKNKDGKNKILKKIVLFRDLDGRLRREDVYNESDSLVREDIYEYTDSAHPKSGRLSERKEWYNNGRTKSKVEYYENGQERKRTNYDKNGNKTLEAIYTPNGHIKSLNVNGTNVSRQDDDLELS